MTGRALVVERGQNGEARRTVTVVTDITEQKQTEEHVRFLLRELSHRTKNLLAVVQGLTHRIVRTSSTLAASHNVLINQNWKAAQLDLLIREQLSSFTDTDANRIHLGGPAIQVNANSAQVIGLAIHELATNAVKHGALALPTGRVSITWDGGEDTDNPLGIHWREADGPLVQTPTRTGFGHTVIRDMIVRTLGAEVQMDFARDGLHGTRTFRSPRFAPTRRPDEFTVSRVRKRVPESSIRQYKPQRG